ncbi:MAG TPA: hypothetical protein VEL51_14725 [Vicinamibacterales bacterium]|nr:hypothetical protein [Vicinamibacterales bacterium]
MKVQGKYDLAVPETLALAAAGLEAEFTLIVDGESARPEDVFGDPRGFIRAPLMHRVGTSYHLPNGTAVYFDTGVIEIATPAMELSRGCMARAGRSLWESIALVRGELDEWERRTGREARLAGFSAHYNTSLARRERHTLPHSRLNRLARALTFVLAAPVMLLATNRRSTGVGVRPRRHRLEITADFTPDPALMIATGSLTLGIVRDVMTWRSWDRDALEREVPVINGFTPMRHTSRRGWLARWDCYPNNPFTSDIDASIWDTSAGMMSLREIANRIFERFGRAIARVSDPFSFRLIASILGRGGPSLLMLPDRPAAYEDVGHGSVWTAASEIDAVKRSRYERALMNAVAGRPLMLFGRLCTPIRVRGWSVVVFRRDADGAQLAIPIDLLVSRLDEWERG